MSEPTQPPPVREHAWGVLGVNLVLLVLLGAGASLAFGALGSLIGLQGEIDGSDRLAEIFADGAPPFSLELADASSLPSGEVLLRLVREVEEPDSDPYPREVVFVEYGSSTKVRPLFRPEDDDDGGGRRRRRGRGNDEKAREASGKMMAWKKDPSFAWNTVLERGEVAWGEWKADYAVARSFEEGGGWRDSTRVNLTQKGRYLVLFAQWAPETESSEEILKELLACVVLQEEADD